MISVVFNFEVRRVLKRYGFRETEDDEDWCLYWTDYSVNIDRVLVMKQWQKINHFPGMSEICRKDSLARNLNRMVRLFPKDYNIFPKSWCLPSDWNEIQNYARKHKSKTYILKPDNGCQGRGIYITKNAKDIRPLENMICQVYISKPFLIDGYKFDMRIYVLLTSCDPLRLFVFKDGLVRFTTCSYAEPNQRNVHDMYMHLTNYAVQKHSDSYIRDNEEGGTKRRITTLNRWFTDNGYDVKKIWDDIDDVIIKTVLSGYAIIKHNYRTCFPNHIQTSACFEILGFDIMFSHRLKPYVLEVNHSPSFTTDSKLDKEIKEAMLWDAVQLAHFTAISKKKCCDEERKRIRNRLLHKSGDKEHRYSIEKEIERYQALSEKYENSHMGNFRLIYPSSDMEKYSPFLNPTATFYQETVTYKVRSECARQLREEIRMKQEKLDIITNKHKASQSESPAPKRLKIKTNTSLSRGIKSSHKHDVINDSNQLIHINQDQFVTNKGDIQNPELYNQQMDKVEEQEQKYPTTECINMPIGNEDNQILPNTLLDNKDVYFIDTKLPQPIFDHEEIERKNELKKREILMHKIGLISMLNEVFTQCAQIHPENLSNQMNKKFTAFNNHEGSQKKIHQPQQDINDKKERALNVLKPTAAWKNRTQILRRQGFWIRNQQYENSAQIKLDTSLDVYQTPTSGDNPKIFGAQNTGNKPSTGHNTENFSIQPTDRNHFTHSDQPLLCTNPVFGSLPSHQSQIQAKLQKHQQSYRIQSENFSNSGIHLNTSSQIHQITGQMSQNLLLTTDGNKYTFPTSTLLLTSNQNCNDSVCIGVKTYQPIRNVSSNRTTNSSNTPLKINITNGFLPSRGIRSQSAMKSKCTLTDLTNDNNNNSNIFYSHNTSRQHSHNSSIKSVAFDFQNSKTMHKDTTPLPTLANHNMITYHHHQHHHHHNNSNSTSPHLIINRLMPAVTSVKLNRVVRRSANQEHHRTPVQ
ncbi:unnamed protein product [Trichobilharzia szidati]|nr:unnamed protein product [Trichobilharzia szidati]